MKKADLIVKVNELIFIVTREEKTRTKYYELCKILNVNVTPVNKAVRHYCNNNETLTNLEQIINICEIALNQ